MTAAQPAPTVDRLARSVDQIISRVAGWQPGRWAVDGRGEKVYALVQRLADRAADAEGQPRRVVPRLADPVLPDQLRVTADDLLLAGAPQAALAGAADDVDEVRRAL